MTSHEKIMKLKAMPEWEFITVILDGFADPCAGCTHKGVYYDEHEIYQAYWERNPEAEPLY